MGPNSSPPLRDLIRPLLDSPDRLPRRSHSLRSTDLSTNRTPSLLRRRSWASFYEKNHSLFEHGSASPHHAASQILALPSSNPSFDIAYFLKNTGPPGEEGRGRERERAETEQKKLGSPKVGLRLFKSHKHGPRGRSRRETVPRAHSDDPFVPRGGVVQKVSRDGKKYLQIIPNTKGYAQQFVDFNNFKNNAGASPESLTVRSEEGNVHPFDLWLEMLETQTIRAAEEGGRRPLDSIELPNSSRGGGTTFGLTFEDCIDSFPAPGGNSTGRAVVDDRRYNEPTPPQSFVSANTDNQSFVDGRSAPQSSGAEECERHGGNRKANDTGTPLGQLPRDRFAVQAIASLDQPPIANGRAGSRSTDTVDERNGHPEPVRDVRSLTLSQTRRIREEKIRARKLRDLRRMRDSIDSVMTRPVDAQDHTDHSNGPIEVPLKSPRRQGLRADRQSIERPLCSEARAAPSTPDRARESILIPGSDSPVVAIAEKATGGPARPYSIPKGRPAAASRVDGPCPRSYRMAPTRGDTPRPGTVSPTRSVMGTACCQTSQHPCTASNGETHPDRPSHHASSSDPSSVAGVGAAFSPAGARASTMSSSRSLKGSFREKEKDVKIERLERENRLLEAALMAVLRTAGRLNGCPCGAAMAEEESTAQVKRALEVYLETRRWMGTV